SGAAGQTDLNVIIDRNLLPEDGRWSVNGYLKLTDGTIKPDKNRRAVESVHGTINFKGRQASIDDGRLRLGASAFALDGIVANILDPEALYRLRAAQLNLADLDLLAGGSAIQLKNFNAKGKAHFDNGALRLDGAALASEGRLADIDFQKMSAEFAWSTAGLTLRNLSLRALDGNLRAEGYLASGGANSAPVELSAQVEAIAMRALLARLTPMAHDRVQGQLDGRGRFAVSSAQGAKTQSALEGSGEAMVRNGLIKDFNLISQLLLRGSGAAVSAQSAARLPPGFAKLLSRTDTPFDSLKADFVVEPARIRTDNLVIQTPDYSITGAGWVGFDRTTRWNGLIVLSPRLTQEVQRDMRQLRYLLDRRGRLAITFRVDGAIPNVRIRLDNRALAQTLRGGTPARDGAPESADRSSQESSSDKKWLPDAVERFFNR
ncbi:MAG: hypothetical protein FJ143_19105, partial [Deltaproteobacteria bacterium]|nr:hypothetical protein [Deltaproteobacteria bacterium]